MADFRTNLVIPKPSEWKDSNGKFNNRTEHTIIFHGKVKNHIRKLRAIFHNMKNLRNKKDFANQGNSISKR
jgi:hypothetical protein